ncbi:fibrinogen-like protein 1 [Myxocyprinus asiaticus]|uniref:fibrinogen-like protein 1 n=1 Tax=Myxocyprinus asiaticus TaxID=70543 RepID=UPI00222348E6|nr:fibrinogen-like protein 1 [Myxocyprinus asiaticus]XP_051539594.1 fibrinogen-like protein 1 [Myxocyprinus asiaticus]
MMMPQLVFILVFHALMLLQTLAEEQCQLSEVSKLKEEILRLNNKLLIGEWKISYLRTHRRFKLLPKLELSLDHNKTSENNTGPLLTLPSTGGTLLVHDKDCSELYDRLKSESGFYRIKPKPSFEPFLVYCDMDDGGGWTVIQKRINGKVDFERQWEDYKNGFGHFQSSRDEFWLGNEHIHALLSDGENVMKINLMDWKGEKSYAMYENFRVSDEKDKYRLHYGMYSGQAGDALSGGANMVEQWSASHNGMQFSTWDKDHDRYLQGSCAKENRGGWWYNRCHTTNLNGRFYRGGEYKAKHDNGVVWSTWRGLWYSLRHTTMKVRPSIYMDNLGSGAGPTE